MRMPITRIVLIACWGLLWCVSLALPAAMMGPNPDHAYTGIIVLMLGWAGVFDGQFGWLANLTLPGVAVLSLIKRAPVGLRAFVAAVQIGLAINALFWNWVADEGGVRPPIDGFGPGYYLWLGVMFGSAAVLLVVTRRDAIDRRRQGRQVHARASEAD
jgi:hypothetical protein